jgi:capsular polysaccharide biosynthesis protein
VGGMMDLFIAFVFGIGVGVVLLAVVLHYLDKIIP